MVWALIQKRVLLGPATLRKTAAAHAEPREAWMLRQPRGVRLSYVREVINASGDEEHLTEIWMLRQPDTVRESYINEVLEGAR